ncbi:MULTISPECIES: DUF6214 family protein [unclassified Streptomyces]|uniref:DUF6214 family protein n=1 Tax=unclassified Streptomyces TaxID=2593676 RepID=UPI000880C6CB|nr:MULTISPECIES: DUF6214 family protein [unclassified Streptomyces]PBC86503.1 hypothetical protein BX261_6598 [Streptomyces sp. 2321.6]SDQ81986.1 hypothetical protein SAMN05216511_0651 [Streptomyces sp. KS_16]SEE00592.1 hypothetical protein SAMN05428940_6626 [Streptomyces sp. 2133.1]SNC73488.1 hypothetical protein SAMN06272741_6527 [Streptomyces sp. 2114.4]
MWELRAHGSAAPAPALDSATPEGPSGSRGPGCPLPRLDPLGPWCSARLTFADGARVDVLVTASDDHLTVEDVRADPPLTLAGLTDLARWIEGPLDDAFRSATGRPHRTRPAPRQAGPLTTSVTTGGEPDGSPQTGQRTESAPEPADAGQGATAGGSAAPATQGEAASGEGATGGEAAASALSAASVTSTTPTAAPVCASSAPSESSAPLGASALSESSGPSTSSESPEPSVSEPSVSGSATASDPSTSPGPSAAAPASGRARSPVLARSRAGERRRVAADAYRRAQREGSDPVLAVMLATGRNRRRALRLIAGARDEGLLTPRHNKR